MKKILSSLVLLVILSSSLYAQREFLEGSQIPKEINAFIEKGTKVLALEKGDLNGDGTVDYILVLEKQGLNPDSSEIEIGQRPLLVIIRNADGTLSKVSRNEKIVFCSTCGGVFGDPFESIQAGTKTFTVNHYGGSNWRWTNSFKFNYSKRDKAWQLVKVEETSFHTSVPNKVKKTVYTPPKDFGKIDFKDFDPENFKGVGDK